MSTVAVQHASMPTALTYSLYERMNEIHNKIAQRAFSLFENNGQTFGHELQDWLMAEGEFLAPIRLELSETETELAVLAEAPGFTEKEIEIFAEPGHLFITGKRQKKSGERQRKTIYSEMASTEIFRSISLPAEIDPEKISAVVKNGVLEVSMQKAKAAKKVPVLTMAA